MSTPISLRVVVLYDTNSGHWIAQGLEHNICVQGDSWRDAVAELKQGVAEQIIVDEHFSQEILGSAPPTPAEFASELFNHNRAIPVDQAAIENIPPKTPGARVDALVANLRLTVRVWT